MIKVLLKIVVKICCFTIQPHLAFQGTLGVSGLKLQSFLEDNRVPLVSQELFHALNAECSVYSSETSQSLDHAGLILRSKTICTPHGAHHQSEITHDPQGL